MEIYSIPLELLKAVLILIFIPQVPLKKYFHRHRKYFKRKDPLE
jgi:hypothetical protein